MPIDPDEDHSDEMADELSKLDEHIGEAEGNRDDIADHAEAPGDPMAGSDDAGAAEQTLSAEGSSADGEEPEEQANPT